MMAQAWAKETMVAKESLEKCDVIVGGRMEWFWSCLFIYEGKRSSKWQG